MSYVAISGEVIDRVVREARDHPDEQVVGVLLGGQSGNAIVIDDAATGAAESNSSHVTLTADSIAKIADDIINKRIGGSIVGWYHSHVRGGVFMSETDVETQLKLQQFSPMVTAMVIDTQTGKSGFFRADAKTKGAVLIPPQNVRTEVVQPAEMALPAPAPSPVSSAYYPQAPPAAAPPAISIRTILLVVLFITLAVTAGMVALVYYRGSGGGGTSCGNLAVKHNPPQSPFTIAHPITFDANVTGSNLSNVTLAYRIIEQDPSGRGYMVGDLRQFPMLLKAAGKDTYSFTLPGSEVSGLFINYYITAFDTSGNTARSDVYTLSVGDFQWTRDRTDEVIVTRTIAQIVSIDIDPINSFSRAVTIKVVGPVPLGVLIAPINSQVVPPQKAQLRITTADNAQLFSRAEVEIDAVYVPPGGGAIQIIRSTTLILTVTDFDMEVFSPPVPEVHPDKEITYTLELKTYDGFTAPNGFQISVNSLPAKATWKLVLVDYRIDKGQMADMKYDLVIDVESGTKTGLYLFSVVITVVRSDGTISHDVTNIQLKVV